MTRLVPPPQPEPQTKDLELKSFLKNLMDSVASLFNNTSRLIENVDSKEVATTDATVTTLDIFELDDETTYHMRTIVIGVVGGGANRASYEFAGTFYRTGAGSATQEGSTTAIHTAESVAGYAATYDVTGTTVRVRVTGAAATAMKWRSTTSFMNQSN